LKLRSDHGKKPEKKNAIAFSQAKKRKNMEKNEEGEGRIIEPGETLTRCAKGLRTP